MFSRNLFLPAHVMVSSGLKQSDEEERKMNMPTHIVAVGAFIENPLGQILLVKTHHGGWVIPGGQVENGENLIDALRREVMEESGIEIEVGKLVGIYSNTSAYKWYDGTTDVPTKLMLDFSCRQIGGVLCTSEETTDSRWVDKGEVLDLVEAPAIRTRYAAYLDFHQEAAYMEYITRPQFEVKFNTTL